MSKPLHGKFVSTVNKLAEEGDVDLDRSWQWLKGGYLTKSTESSIIKNKLCRPNGEKQL